MTVVTTGIDRPPIIVGGMKRPSRFLFRGLALIAATLLGSLLPALPARADDGWAVSRYAMTVDLGRDGTAKINLDFDFDFGTEEGHGPYLVLPSRQEIPGDPDHWRSFPIELGEVTSPTGAPTDVDTETKNGLLAIKIGDEDREVSGRQTYRVEYTIRGLVNPRATGSGLDELNWNVISDWEVPLRDVSITVDGPAAVDRVRCLAGATGAQTECDAAGSGTGARFQAAEVPAGDGMTVVAGWPGGTFVGAEPILTKRHHLGNTFVVNPLTAGLGGAIAALGAAGLAVVARRRGRDERYTGLTPGLLPAAGEQATTRQGGRGAPVAVRFTPPDGAAPAEVGTLIDEVVHQRDIAATVIDLAVRGHLRITELEPSTASKLPGGRDWDLRRLDGGDGLRPHEEAVLQALFAGRSSTTMSAVAESGRMGQSTIADRLYRQMVELGWFQDNPQQVRGRWYLLSGLTVAAGILATVLLAIFVGGGIVGLGLVLLGVIGFVFARTMPARTATGSAMLDQAEGFRLYLRTAEADQLRFEEGEDLFSRYLPYAIIFGLTERWAKLFAELAAQGHDVPQPSWYTGTAVGSAAFYGSGGFTDSLSAFSSATTAMTASSSGSGGGSGFSGGSVGGGVGGGGGGGW